MATATQQRPRHHRHFPRKLGRFINLEGGLYGQLDIVAITAHLVELQTGEDFIRFNRAQATNLRDTLDKFLAFDPSGGASGEEPQSEEVEAEAVVEEEQDVVTRPRRPRRRKPS